MVHLKRIILTVFTCQAVLVLLMVRRQLLKTTEINNKVTISRRHVGTKDKTSSRTKEDKSNSHKLSISLEQDSLKIPLISKDITVRLNNSGNKLFKRANSKADSTDLADTSNGQRIITLHEEKFNKTVTAFERDNESTEKKTSVVNPSTKYDNQIDRSKNFVNVNQDNKDDFGSANQKSNSGDDDKAKNSATNSSNWEVVSTMNEKDKKQADFLINWCRVQKARTDWKSILRPCENNTVWGRNTQETHPQSSAENSFITKWEIKPAGRYSRFVVQSMSKNNETKSIGGDSWRVHLRGPATIAPTVFDHNNGTYEMLFLVMEPGEYKVDMWLDYTLCNGLKDPPPYWYRLGNVQGKNQPDGILKGDKPFLIQKFRPNEPIPTFNVIEDPSGFKPAPGRADCACPSLHWDGLGRWVDNTWKPYLQEKVQVRNHTQGKGKMIFFGDSVSNHFQESIVKGPYHEVCYKSFDSCGRVYHWVYDMKGYWGPGHTEPGPDGKDYDHDRVLRDVRKTLYGTKMDENSALLFNWGIHFTAVTTFNDYQRLIQDFVKIIKHGETDPKTGEFRKFKGQFFWKTTTAINRHRFPKPHKDVRRFLTFPRVLLFNAFATSIMCQSGIDVIDVYPISDAYPGGTTSKTDPVHYAPVVFREVEKLLFETFDDGVQ